MVLVRRARRDPDFLARLEAELDKAIDQQLADGGKDPISGSLGDISFSNSGKSLTADEYALYLDTVIALATGEMTLAPRSQQVKFGSTPS